MVQQYNLLLFPRREVKLHSRMHTSSGRQQSAPIHRRIVRHRPLGAPLHKFKKNSQVIDAMKDALFAHQKLHDEAGILHRDISPSHILIGERGGGVLVDWDDDPFALHDRSIQADETSEELSPRIGTMQFLSPNLITEPLKFPKPDRADNHESFFHVLRWLSLVWGEHPRTGFWVTARVLKMYEQTICDYIWCSYHTAAYKKDDIIDRFMKYDSGYRRLASKPIRDLLVDLEAVVVSRYDDDESRPTLDELQIGKKRYESKMDMLMDSEWMIERFAKAARELSIAGDTARVNRYIEVSVLNGVEGMAYYLDEE
ncbi:hypothetical protein Moror_9623 [Moniliophthora roreri MCA 2997]|uniref:Protein kinase domain-containing protein n=2 Tax=Moniliophthora roreri TaxID=221103 RepID=V2WMS7_MONRO|nr:hypothetical protein Moror_9623 [Moniliophthora roreri MCA 2997]KAI3597623.1 hypothetical protein WG66_003142 [Moniliophthora roreri]